MKIYRSIVLMQEQACGALMILAVNAGNQVKIAEASGIEALV